MRIKQMSKNIKDYSMEIVYTAKFVFVNYI